MLVTGVNDADEEMDRMATLLSRMASVRQSLKAQVLRLHHMGVPKYEALGVSYELGKIPCPASEKVKAMEARLKAAGVRVQPWEGVEDDTAG